MKHPCHDFTLLVAAVAVGRRSQLLRQASTGVDPAAFAEKCWRGLQAAADRQPRQPRRQELAPDAAAAWLEEYANAFRSTSDRSMPPVVDARAPERDILPDLKEQQWMAVAAISTLMSSQME